MWTGWNMYGHCVKGPYQVNKDFMVDRRAFTAIAYLFCWFYGSKGLPGVLFV